MDIILKELGSGGSSFTFPSLPEKIDVSRNAKYQSYDLINGKTYKLPQGKECNEISWSGTFFGEGRYRKDGKSLFFPQKDFMKPKECEKTLAQWMKKGKPLKLVVTGTGINLNVTISKLETSREGGYGDMSYSIAFVQYHSLKIYTMKELNRKSGKKEGRKRQNPARQKAKGGLIRSGRGTPSGGLPISSWGIPNAGRKSIS